MMRYILLFIYVIINAFLYVLNYEVFNSIVNLDFGFGIYSIMPIVLIQILGLLFVLGFYFNNKNSEFKHNIEIERHETKYKILQQEHEIEMLKMNIPETETVAQDQETIIVEPTVEEIN
jgi:uncharacterized membrane protein